MYLLDLPKAIALGSLIEVPELIGDGERTYDSYGNYSVKVKHLLNILTIRRRIDTEPNEYPV